MTGLELTPSLIERGISNITKEGNNTICIEFNGKSLRSTIYKNDVTRTIKNILGMIVTNAETRGAIKSFISDNWIKLFPDPNKESDFEDGVEQSQTEAIIELASINCKFFKDQYGVGYALVKVKNHYESMPLNSHKFKMHLVNSYRESVSNKPPNESSISSAILSLQAEAEYNTETIPLHIRVAWSDDEKSIYYDLSDEEWKVMKIDKNKVDILMGPDVKFPLFRRYSQTPQPIPNPDYKPDIYDKFMSLTNVKNKDDILLTKVAIITIIIPDIERIVFNVNGGQGAGKTALEMAIKWLVDPDKPTNLLTIPHDKIEFIQQLSHRHIAFYDNLKSKKSTPWLAEEVCKASTGGGTTKKKLYTDEDDIFFDYKLTIGFNGINMILNEPDVLRRSIIIELKTIEDENKIQPKVLRAKFEEIKADVLGYIFNIVSKAMSIKDSLELKSIPGLSDFAVWGEAISRAMGYEEMEFIEAYNRNIARQNEEVVESDSFAKTITLLYEELYSDEISNIKQKFKLIDGSWCISGNGFLEQIERIAQTQGIEMNEWFPKAVNRMSHRLNIIKTNLKAMGIDIRIRRSVTNEDVENGFDKNTSIVEISGDGGDAASSFMKNEYNMEGNIEEEYGGGAGKTPTISTAPLELQDRIFNTFSGKYYKTCPKCNHRDQSYYMKIHNCGE